ncbi:hypothetical protein APS_1660 [Acetobacter pasteurianus subsp. pasteurianus LMG 1262 = NBRC 106471]|uniref:hypothetical protein n=1 Tax=Acetobacter pasteurianus TaxID=438 RepID=UPI0002458014|nr:hypothetical protein [Acetobacter pasteurianus]GAB31058.1 hypothetical protein APS_1660 [Acetobacter pasteurianus subsp. pasteurianus LMG 1262 = NBRC 106471]
MFQILLAIVSLAIWASIVIYYFRNPIYEWLDNRFGKDTPLADLESADKRDDSHKQNKG